MEAPMTRALSARPNLEHLRGQAKSLLARLKRGDEAAARDFIEHLPAARRLEPAAVRARGLRLADAQSVVARQAGFDRWSALVLHVEALRGLEGEWRFTSLEVDGRSMPPDMLAPSRVLFDGDRFRTESPEANYDGTFAIDVNAIPATIDIHFVEGPEAGNVALGIFERRQDTLTLCLGLVGAERPRRFAAAARSGHALERLRRVSGARPDRVTGGTAAPLAASATRPADASGFAAEMTPALASLEGEWLPTALVQDGAPMPAEWLAYGSRVSSGNQVTVVFGGQTMLHATMRIDATSTPMRIDYLHLSGRHKGAVSCGLLEWIGQEFRVLMPPPGDPRPAAFEEAPKRGTLSRWRRR
jgi:uncharacterized protein (TIGR03067 family)